jgi:hypothetical protein
MEHSEMAEHGCDRSNGQRSIRPIVPRHCWTSVGGLCRVQEIGLQGTINSPQTSADLLPSPPIPLSNEPIPRGPIDVGTGTP